MVLLAQAVYGHIRHSLGGALSAQLAPQDIANQAGHWLVNVHPWKCFERFANNLNVRASFSLTGCTWTEATKTLTKTTGFATYAFLRGDTVQVTAGADAIPGFYLIASRTSANAIVLDTSIGAAADADTDIAVTIDASGIALPSDLAEVLSLEVTDALNTSIQLTTLAELNARKQRSTLFFNGSTWAAVSYSQPFVAGGGVVPRLETWPAVSANTTAGVKLVYRAGWKTLAFDDDFCSIPEAGWMDSLYLRVVRAWGRGYEEEDERQMNERLDEILASGEFAAVVRRDGAVQSELGPLTGGALAEAALLFDPSKPFLVSPPA